MPSRTIKGQAFTIIVDGKRITVKHVAHKGKRCRVTIPVGVKIEIEGITDAVCNRQTSSVDSDQIQIS